MKYDFSEDAKLREVLQQIITFEDINIEIVGCLIWVDGNTYDYKDTLKTHKNLIDSSHTISKIYKKVNRFLKVYMVKYNYSKGTKRNFGETHRKRGDSDGMV